ncbi:MAG: Ig-like domain-containing protein [Hyphomicrobiaceae bacterium]
MVNTPIFDIELSLSTTSPNPASSVLFTQYLPYLEAAAAFWELAIVGEVPLATPSQIISLNPGFTPSPVITVDDIIILIGFDQLPSDPNDPTRSPAAQGEPLATRSGSSIPAYGLLTLDDSGLGNVLGGDGPEALTRLMIHEIGHALGFGTLWDTLGLVQSVNGAESYVGANALAEFRPLNNDPSATVVPIETQGGSGTALQHWDSTLFAGEIFGTSVSTLAISRISLGAMADLGYTIDLGAADPFALPATPGALFDDVAGNYFSKAALPLGGSIAATIEQSDDNDWFRVELAAGTEYVFEMAAGASGSGTLADPFLTLRALDGEILATGGASGQDATITFTPAAAGVYFLDASDIGTGTGSYVLRSLDTYSIEGAPETGESGTLAFVVSRTFGDAAASVDLLLGGTATLGIDYAVPTLTVSFLPGETEKTIEITTRSDGSAEGSETVTVSLDPTGINVDPAAASATGTIVDVPLPEVTQQNFFGSSGSPGFEAPFNSIPGANGGNGGSGGAGQDASASISATSITDGSNASNTTLRVIAFGGSGGSGGGGADGVQEIQTSISGSTTTATYATGGNGGHGGEGGAGGNAIGAIATNTISTGAGFDVVLLDVFALGGSGGNGGEGGFGGSGGFNANTTTTFLRDNSQSQETTIIIPGPAGAPGLSNNGGDGESAIAEIVQNSVDLGAEGGIARLFSTANGGFGGFGGRAVGGLDGVTPPLAGDGGGGGSGGNATGRLSGNGLSAAGSSPSTSSTFMLEVVARGGSGGLGGEGGDPGVQGTESGGFTFQVDGIALDVIGGTTTTTVTQGTGGAGGTGGSGGDAIAEMIDNQVIGGMGIDHVSLSAQLIVGSAGIGGIGGQPAPAETVTEAVGSAGGGTAITSIGGGVSGPSGTDGLAGSAELRITGNNIDLGGGNDSIAIVAAAPVLATSFTFDISGNTFDGGAGTRDTLNLSGLDLGIGVSMSFLAGTLQVGNGANTITGIEGFVGTAHDDTIEGDDLDNTLEGGDGNNTIVGGAGDDLILADHDNGTDLITGSAGDDWIIATGNAVSTAVFSGARADYDISVANGLLYIAHLRNVQGSGDGRDVLVDVDFLRFTDRTESSSAYNNGPLVSIELAPASDLEGATFTLTATRTGDLSGVTRVDYDITGPSGFSAADLATPLTGTLIFAAGQATVTRSIATADDSLIENDETFSVTLSNASGGSIGNGTAQATIVDNDVPSTFPIVTIALTPASAEEGNGYTLTASTSALSALPITVDYAIAGDPASPGFTAADIDIPLTGTITIAPASFTEVLTFNSVDDTVAEADETFSIAISNPVNGAIVVGLGTTTSATILNDDAGPLPPTVSISISSATAVTEGGTIVFDITRVGDLTQDTFVNYTITGSAGFDAADIGVFLGNTILIPAGDATVQLVVPTGNDSTVEADDSFTVTLSGPVNGLIGIATATATILNDDLPPVNAPPVATGDAFTVAEDQTLSIAAPGLLGNDSDADGDPLSALLVAAPASGTLTLSPNGAFTYTPDADFAGIDSFTYQASDGQVVSNVATVTLTVTPVADPAAISGTASGSVTEDGLLLASGALVIDDPDANESRYQPPATLAGLYGTFSFDALSGAWSYTLDNTHPDVQSLDAGQSLPDTLTVTSLDGSATQDIVVTILGADEFITNGASGGLLNGTSASDLIDAGGGNDIVRAGAGNDTVLGGPGMDLIDGGSGRDVMSGGTGNDTYVVDRPTDVVNELQGQGTDTVRVVGGGSYRLSANVENLIYAGNYAGVAEFVGRGNDLSNEITGGNGQDLLFGFGGRDLLRGRGGADRLYGGAGSDILDGGSGSDVMRGGPGNDTYVVDRSSDVVIEIAGDGVDTVQVVAGRSYQLRANVENLDYLGSYAGIDAFTGIGNGGRNILTGGSRKDVLSGLAGSDQLFGLGGADELDGGAGNDRLIGGRGNDTLIGGLGEDQFVFEPGFGRDRITDFDPYAGGGQDLIVLSGFGIDASTFASRVSIVKIGFDTRITIDNDLNQTLMLAGVAVPQSVTVEDFLFG